MPIEITKNFLNLFNNMHNQVQDDFSLLELMNQDMELANELFKPTNYWAYKAAFLQPSLKEEGLKDFRRKSVSVFASIGGVDVYPKWWIDTRKFSLLNNRLNRVIPNWDNLLIKCNKIINNQVVCSPKLLEYLKVKPYRYAKKLQKETGARPVEAFEASLAGNPEYYFTVNGKNYTNNIFDYYIRYAYCCKFVDFENIKVIVELGSGSCKLTEVIKKLHPHITFLNFDISPQLYVGERYLDTIFPGDVESYKNNRDLKSIPELKPGKIYMFGSWQFPLLKDLKYDMFFNLTSFQEMEPYVVSNYIQYINGNPKYVYLHQKMDGKEVAAVKGEFGVMEPTKLSHYQTGFSHYKMINIEDSRMETGELKWKGHKDTFWVRKDEV